jgi:hypothetical protein
MSGTICGRDREISVTDFCPTQGLCKEQAVRQSNLPGHQMSDMKVTIIEKLHLDDKKPLYQEIKHQVQRNELKVVTC